MGNRDASEKQRHLRIQRTEPDRLFGVLDRLAILPRKSEDVAEMSSGPPPNSD